VTQGPLSGIRVVDLGQIYNGPYATLLMALAGAEVIKIEPPTGENLRSRGRVKGAGSPFVMLNSNKRGITLNLKHPTALELLDRLVEDSDVLVENFRPGVTERLGFGAERMLSLNPRLIYASGSGFGSTGRYRDFAAMDLTIQAFSGVMSVTGFPDREPVKAGPALGDFLGGIHLYAGIVTAIVGRQTTGKGSVVEVSMLDSVYPSLMSSLGLFFGATGDIPSRTGNRHAGLAESPYNVYPVADGYVAIICVSDSHWASLCGVLGRPDLADDDRYSSRISRVERMDDVDAIVAESVKRFCKEDLFTSLSAAGVPCAPVREIAEVVTDPHLHERGMLQQIEHPEVGSIVVPHTPLRVGDHRERLRPSPALGQDNDYVYGTRLGLSSERIKELAQEGVI